MRISRATIEALSPGTGPGRLSAESVAPAYAQDELHLVAPMPSGSGQAPTRSVPTTASGRPPVSGPARPPHQRHLGRDPGRGPSELAVRTPEHQISIWCSNCLQLALLGQRRGQCSTLFYLCLP
jgi:hypothetical protein